MSEAFGGGATSSAFERALQDESGNFLTAADLKALESLDYNAYVEAFNKLP
jgi:hypothetical protein